MTTSVETYLLKGCGRCALGGTPDCKVYQWTYELKQLQAIALESGLTEECKWGVPCYTYQGINVLIICAFKNYCSLSFFKGVLLKDDQGILQKQGENSQSARLIKFTTPQQVADQADTLRAYIYEAIEVEKAGLKVDFKAKDQLDYPEELLTIFENDQGIKEAFEALTPGRKRGYVIHFSQPKQSATRISRIEKCIPKIMEGKGFHDR